MNNALAYRRLLLLAVLLTLAFAGLGGWVGYVQLGQRQRLSPLAHANLEHKSVRPAPRGSIRDTRGNVLATSVPVKTVCADPSLLGPHRPLVARTLAPILELSEARLLQQFAPQLRTNAAGKLITNAYVVLKHKVPLQQWQQVTQAMAGLTFGLDERKLKSRQRLALQAVREKAVFGEDDQLRQYPGRSLAAHVLGFVATEEAVTDQGHVVETRGVNGIELSCDKLLSGVHGWCDGGAEVAARRGLDVVLTLDAGVQNIVEAELEQAMQKYSPRSLSAIVVVPRTGAILALANLPTFDPNRPGVVPVENLRNRALSDPSEPGSTFKVVVVAGALDAQVVSLADTFDCEHGRFLFAGRSLGDHASYGSLTVENIITKSSNIGAAKIGIKLGPDRLYDCIRRFGFGERSGVPLPGESRGYIRRVVDWEKISISRLPMGHELLVTPMQMLMAVAAIANEGRLMRPMIIERLQDEQGNLVKQFRPEVTRQAVSPATAGQMTRALKTVVSPTGTAQKAKLDHYTAAGKTGTAERFVNGTYKSGYYFSSFIGFFPADEPELCIGVMFDHLHDPDRKKGHYGGEVAGPVFRAIGEKVASYLRLPPEPAPEPPTEAAPELSVGAAYAVNGLGSRSPARPAKQTIE
jgi:cell division protein FtsI/penicillin-binding protein 2